MGLFALAERNFHYRSTSGVSKSVFENAVSRAYVFRFLAPVALETFNTWLSMVSSAKDKEDTTAAILEVRSRALCFGCHSLVVKCVSFIKYFVLLFVGFAKVAIHC